MISDDNPPRPPYWLGVAVLLGMGLGTLAAFWVLMAVCRVLEGG